MGLRIDTDQPSYGRGRTSPFAQRCAQAIGLSLYFVPLDHQIGIAYEFEPVPNTHPHIILREIRPAPDGIRDSRRLSRRPTGPSTASR